MRLSLRTALEAIAAGAAIVVMIALGAGMVQAQEAEAATAADLQREIAKPPTIREVEVQVEIPVEPPGCHDAIYQLNGDYIQSLDFVIKVYGAYLDHPEENLTEFGRRVELIIASAPDAPDPDEHLDPFLACSAP